MAQSDNLGVMLEVDNMVVNLQLTRRSMGTSTARRMGEERDDGRATKESCKPDQYGQARGNRGPDARGGTVLLSTACHGSENRTHHRLGRRRVRLHAQPG